MNRLSLNEDPFYLTFPHRLTPLPEEWLPGLLLRCDEVNHWASRTTLAYLLHPGPEKFHRCWRTKTPNLSVILPSSLHLDHLARTLDISLEALLATTYQAELARLSDDAKPHPTSLTRWFSFHLCPICLAEHRVLRRTLALPHLTLCPQHHVALQSRCHCGEPLHLFHRQAAPFTCSTCGLDWSHLPRIEASSECLAADQKLLRWYEFWFSEGTPQLMQRAKQFAARLIEKEIEEEREWSHVSLAERSAVVARRASGEAASLGGLVGLLVKHHVSADDFFPSHPYPLFLGVGAMIARALSLNAGLGNFP